MRQFNDTKYIYNEIISYSTFTNTTFNDNSDNGLNKLITIIYSVIRILINHKDH